MLLLDLRFFPVIGLLLSCAMAPAQVSVWTHHNDNARTGANLSETVLNTNTVNPQQFGKLFSYPVDSEIYAQPLYVPGVAIAGKGLHNVVIAATMNDSVYAFDADSNAGGNASPLWFVNFTSAAAGVTAVPPGDVQRSGDFNVQSTIGILGTPVIDVGGGTIYVVARTKENGNYFFRLHALSLASGAERPNSPVAIGATIPGSGYDSVGGMVTFNPLRGNQRAALTLANGVVYIAFASLGDIDPYHGWLFAYGATTLQQMFVLNDTPNGTRGGIWQSGNGAAIDPSGSLYLLTGNGDWDGVKEFGSSVLKLNPTGLAVTDYFTPSDYQTENQADLDLGASGPILIPGTNLIAGGGKEGILYVAPTGNLGHLQTAGTTQVQALQAAAGHIHGAPVYWNSPRGPLLYVWGEQSYLSAFHFNGTTFDTVAAMRSAFPAPNGMPGAALSISANGSAPGTGVLWASLPLNADAETQDVAGILRAFDANNLSNELWDSQLNPGRDSLGLFSKYSPPTVANGKVYLATFSNQLCVYGIYSPDFQIASATATQGVAQGSTIQFQVAVTPLLGLTTPVQLSAQNLPPGTTTSFSPAAVSGPGTSQLTIATGPTTSPGKYSVMVTGTAGTLVRTLTITVIVNPGVGAISGAMSLPVSTQNLTSQGSADWVHWGTNGSGFDRKSQVSPAIGTLTLLGSAPLQYYANNPFGFSWTDGQPNGIITNTATGVYTVGAGNGFQVMVPADTSARTVTLYAGVFKAQANVTASLSDFSAPPYVNTTLQNAANSASAAYTITYQAASPGQILTLTVVEAAPAIDPAGNVTLQSVALQTAALPDFSLSASPAALSVTSGGNSASAAITVGAANGFSSPVTLTASGLPANVSASFQPAVVQAGLSKLTFTASAGAAAGTYPISIQGVSASGLRHWTSISLTVASGSAAGTLTGSVAVPQGVQNLSALGKADWVHWGLNGAASVDRLAGMAPEIGTLSTLGGAQPLPYANNPFGFSWTNGSPDAVVAQTATGLYVSGQNAGFQFTVPADTKLRTLTVFAGVYQSQAKLSAVLSDGSAPLLVDTSVINASGQLSAVYTLTYNAASANQTLLVTVVPVGPGTGPASNVTLQAAALSTGPPANLTGSITIPVATQNLTAAGSADWMHWIDTANFERKAGVAPQISAYTIVGANPVFAYANNPSGFSWTDGTPVAASPFSSTGLWVGGPGNGFQLSAPADTNWRTLTVYAGVYKSTGTLRAVLSDGSSAPLVDSSITSTSGSVSAAYTLHYRANTASQTLTVSYTQAAASIDPFSNVTLQAAALANQ